MVWTCVGRCLGFPFVVDGHHLRRGLVVHHHHHPRLRGVVRTIPFAYGRTGQKIDWKTDW
jgi:hypothetical protein